MEKREVKQVGTSIKISQEEAAYSGDELLAGRADISVELGVRKLHDPEGGLGGIQGEEEAVLKEHKKRSGWYEPHPGQKKKQSICLVCGTEFEGRPNRKYCSPKCGSLARMRKHRAKRREIADFKPHRGPSGQVFFMATEKGKDVITFVPAFYADSRAKAEQYLRDNFEDAKNLDDYIQQVNEVIKK